IGRTALIPESKEIAGIQDVRELQAALLASARARGESPAPKKLASQARIVMASREIRQNLAVLERLGSEAVYLSADVTDTAATKQVISDVRSRWGRVDMLIHAAGLIADKRLSEKSFEQFMEVYGTKVLGLRSLLEATDDDPLRFIGLFSSVAGRYGNAGQSDYAMANAALNRIAGEQARRRGSRCVVRSLNWGPWDGGMVTPELRDHFAAKGVSIMSMQEGAAAFVRELCHPSTELAEVDVVLAARSKAKPTQIVY
ncbi:MAG TPA: SDR family NAD(P)-dependent oxidoreductase, partial [Burkholderiales bacterium]|nr:SDR family NAD(P)-dependent oxidoreductase [Burkholderiales bacterium]